MRAFMRCLLVWVLSLSLMGGHVSMSFSQSLNLTEPFIINTLASPGHHFQPPVLTGLAIHPSDPFAMDFFINDGDEDIHGVALEREVLKMVRYFLAALAIPDDELWVNLSPHEPERMLPASLAKTEMGSVLLAQDYLLKKMTAALMHPEDSVGREFWQNIYSAAGASASDLPVNLFHKVWIVPDNARVYVQGQNVFVTGYDLKVMLEQDYLAQPQHSGLDGAGVEPISRQQQALVREHILPALEDEINHGQHFAPLRQIMNAMVLGKWYKQRLRQSFLGQALIGQGKVEHEAKASDQKQTFAEYLQLFSNGLFDTVQESYDPHRQKLVSRKFLVGGVDVVSMNVAEDGLGSEAVADTTTQATTKWQPLPRQSLIEKLRQIESRMRNFRNGRRLRLIYENSKKFVKVLFEMPGQEDGTHYDQIFDEYYYRRPLQINNVLNVELDGQTLIITSYNNENIRMTRILGRQKEDSIVGLPFGGFLNRFVFNRGLRKIRKYYIVDQRDTISTKVYKKINDEYKTFKNQTAFDGESTSLVYIFSISHDNDNTDDLDALGVRWNFFKLLINIFSLPEKLISDLLIRRYFPSLLESKLVQEETETVGGVDLNPQNYTIHSSGDDVGMRWPEVSPEQVSTMPFDFIVPVLKSIQPVQIPFSLGLNDAQADPLEDMDPVLSLRIDPADRRYHDFKLLTESCVCPLPKVG